jgi:hypothetical protein
MGKILEIRRYRGLGLVDLAAVRGQEYIESCAARLRGHFHRTPVFLGHNPPHRVEAKASAFALRFRAEERLKHST